MLRRITSACLLCGCIAAAVLCCAGPASIARAGGLDSESNTDGFNPSAELYDLAEAQRQAHIARQHALIDAMQWSTFWAPGDLWGPPIGGPPARQPIGHESRQIGPDRWMYRPLYPEDVGAVGVPAVESPPGESLPAPAVEGARGVMPPGRGELPAPSDAAPSDRVQQPPRAKPPVARGPREF